MIRPATLLSIAAALGSGLYLYAEKHQASMLDHQVGLIYRATQDAHARTAQLQTEWALLNDPQHLQDMAGKYLPLKPIEPSQYVQLEQLGAHLPSPDGQPPAPAAAPAQVADAAAAEEPVPDAPVPDAPVPDAQVPGAAFVDAPEPGAPKPAPKPKPPAPLLAAATPVVSAPSTPVKEAPRFAELRRVVPSPVHTPEPERIAGRAEPKPRASHPMLLARAEPPRAAVTAPVTAHVTDASFEVTMEKLLREAHPPGAAHPVPTHRIQAQQGTGYLPEYTSARRPAAPERETPRPPQAETVIAYAQPQQPSYPRWAAAQPRTMPQPYYAAAPGYSYAPPGYYSRY